MKVPKRSTLLLTKPCYFFITIFFLINILQQVGRREDFPFTYFGMYKKGRQNTSHYYSYIINYYVEDKKIILNSINIDTFFIKKKLQSIIQATEYKPNNDKVLSNIQILNDKHNEINQFFNNYIVEHLNKKNIYDESGSLELQIKYWVYLKKDNRNYPDKDYIYHKITLKKLKALSI
jgi:hypothetical protein